MKKTICLALCALMLLCSLTSCSKPPEYAEIEGRFRELVTASAEINELFFGAGLPTYERVEDPRSSTKLFIHPQTGEPFHYYTFTDKTAGEILAYRPYVETKVYVHPDTQVKYFYSRVYDDTLGWVILVDSLEADLDVSIQLLDAPKEGEEPYYVNEEKGEYGYLLEGFTYDTQPDYRYLVKEDKLRLNKEAPLYQNEEKGEYYYLLADYKEPEYESFYTDEDPADYDYVRADSKYLSISEMKSAAEKVYSKEYLDSIYETLFVGTVGVIDSVSGVSPRYMDYAAQDGSTSLMKSNTVEPYFTETRQYDFSTAKVVKPANKEYVTVSVETYLPSKPQQRLTVKVGMILQEGVWMLDSATY